MSRLARLLATLQCRIAAMVRRIGVLLARVRAALAVLRHGAPASKNQPFTLDWLQRRRGGAHEPGFDCPQCGALVTVDLVELLIKAPVYCSQCKLRMKMEWQDDERARRAITGVLDARQRVEAARHFKV